MKWTLENNVPRPIAEFSASLAASNDGRGEIWSSIAQLSVGRRSVAGMTPSQHVGALWESLITGTQGNVKVRDLLIPNRRVK